MDGLESAVGSERRPDAGDLLTAKGGSPTASSGSARCRRLRRQALLGEGTHRSGQAVLRRAAGPLAGAVPGTPVELSDGDLWSTCPAGRSRDGASIALTAREFELLVFLMRPPARAIREDLLQHVWGYSFGDSSTVTVHVRRLREKIEDDASRPDRITTVWGVGYRWVGSSMTDLDRATA